MFGIGIVEVLILMFLTTGAAIAFGVILSKRGAANANLQPCPDCNRMVSKVAAVCPGCGRPMAKV